MYGFSIPSNSPVLCRRQLGVLQFNSNYREGQHRPHRLKAQFHRTGPTSEANHKSQVTTYTSDQLAIIQGSHNSCLSSVMCQNGSQNSGRSFIYVYWFIIKDTTHEVKWKRYIGQAMGEGNFHALSGHTTVPAPQSIHQPGRSLNLAFSDFYGGLIT